MLVVGSLAAIPAKAQVNVSINIGSQPQWGPSGYNHVDYYYLPDVQSYYYVPTRKFIYLNGNNWVHSTYLPGRYRNYDLYRGRKVVINSPRPYLRHNSYRTRYVGHYNNRTRYVNHNNNRTRYVSRNNGRNNNRNSVRYNRNSSRQQYQNRNSRPRGEQHYSSSRSKGNHGKGNSNNHRNGRG